MNKIVICHSRHNFYNKPIWWYEFETDGEVPLKFLRVGNTKYFEYGGTHYEAMADLTKQSFDIIEGKEI